MASPSLIFAALLQRSLAPFHVNSNMLLRGGGVTHAWAGCRTKHCPAVRSTGVSRKEATASPRTVNGLSGNDHVANAMQTALENLEVSSPKSECLRSSGITNKAFFYFYFYRSQEYTGNRKLCLLDGVASNDCCHDERDELNLAHLRYNFAQAMINCVSMCWVLRSNRPAI